MKELIVRVGDSAFRGGLIPDIKQDVNIMQKHIKEINELIINDINEMRIKELLNRIDKAIFYLENGDYGKMRFGIDLLEILKGDK